MNKGLLGLSISVVVQSLPLFCAFAADDGLSVVKRFKEVPRFGVRYANVLEIDPGRYRIKTVSARNLLRRGRASVPKLMQELPEAEAAINAGFFGGGEGSAGDFDGLFIENGKLQKHNDKQKRVFYVTSDGKPGIKMLGDLPKEGIESAVAGLSAGSHADATARTAVCITEQGRVKFVLAYPVQTLNKMARYLKEEEGCQDFVHLDGGGSSQMVYDGGTEDSFAVGWERKPECYTGDEEQPPACFRYISSALVVVAR